MGPDITGSYWRWTGMVLKTGMLASGNLGSDLCELSIGQCQSYCKYPVVAAVTIQGARNIQTY